MGWRVEVENLTDIHRHCIGPPTTEVGGVGSRRGSRGGFRGFQTSCSWISLSEYLKYEQQ